MNEEPSWNLSDAQAKVEAWQRDYNELRPHRSLGRKTLVEFMQENENRLTDNHQTTRLRMDRKWGMVSKSQESPTQSTEILHELCKYLLAKDDN